MNATALTVPVRCPNGHGPTIKVVAIPKNRKAKRVQ